MSRPVRSLACVFSLLSAVILTTACSDGLPMAPTSIRPAAAVTPAAAFAADGGARVLASDRACWGQATKVFAQTGELGPHSSAQETPRIGLRNLAVALHAQGILPEPTLQALGAFVAQALGLSIDACMRD